MDTVTTELNAQQSSEPQAEAALLHELTPPVHEQALLAKLTMKRVKMSYNDEELAKQARDEYDDQSIVMNRKLFREDGNPVRLCMTLYGQVYTAHRLHSFPYIDKGPRVVPMRRYTQYTTMMRDAIERLNKSVASLEPIWDKCIEMDVAFRCKFSGDPSKIDRNEYPTYDEFLRGTSYELSIRPLQKEDHFLFGVSEADRQAFRDEQKRIQEVVRQDTVSRLVAPLTTLISKLAIPIGEKGLDEKGRESTSTFRDTMLTNVSDAIAQVRDMHIEGNAFEKLLDELSNKFKTYEQHPEYLRESPYERQVALNELQELNDKLTAYDFL